MTVYFTYHIYHPSTNKHYYGARWKPGCTPNDLWTTYFTSSKKVHKLIKEYGKESFVVEIRKTFDDKKSCLEWEQNVLKKLKVKRNDNWLNVAIGKPTMLGRKHSAETIQKMRKPKSIPWSDERRENKKKEMLLKIAEGTAKIPSTKGLKYKLKRIECPHCKRKVGINAINRYHNNNCKSRSNT